MSGVGVLPLELGLGEPEMPQSPLAHPPAPQPPTPQSPVAQPLLQA